MFRSILIFVTCLLIMQGCADKDSYKKPLPDWYLDPKHDTSEYFYSVGKGINRQEAKDNALSFISSRITTNIKSQISISKKRHNQNFYDEVHTNIQSSTKNITFVNVQVLETSILHGEFYIFLKVPKNKIFNHYMTKVEKQFNSLKSKTMTSLNNKGFLLKHKAELLADIQKLLANVLITKGIQTHKTINKFELRIFDLKEKILSRASNIKFYVKKPKSGTMAFYQEFKKVLTNKKIQISSNKNVNNRPLCLMDTSINENSFKQWKTLTAMTHITCKVNNEEFDNFNIRTSAILGKNRKRTIEALARQFANKIEKEITY